MMANIYDLEEMQKTGVEYYSIDETKVGKERLL